jgi:hypothetical protein
MREDIYTVLEKCLTLLDQGSDLESCLARYPEHASELRPLLMASLDAESLSLKEIPVDVVRRSKSKVLNVAAEMREQKSKKKPFFVLPPKRIFRFSLVALITLLMVVGVGGTSLVRASTVSLPGDQFYPVKITWENLLLKLAVSQNEREALEERFERERVEEVEDLIASDRTEDVKFYGHVDGIFPDQISVSGIQVMINPQTRVDGQLSLNAWVRVEGETTPEGLVVAKKIKVESIKSHEEGNTNENGSKSTPGNDDSGKGSGKSGDENQEDTKTPEVDEESTLGNGGEDGKDSGKSGSESNASTPGKQSFELEGIVSEYDGSSISVGNRTIFIIPATEFNGSPVAGSRVSIKGYINEEGVTIALKIDVKSDPGGDNGGDNGGNSGDSGDDDDDPTKTPDPED